MERRLTRRGWSLVVLAGSLVGCREQAEMVVTKRRVDRVVTAVAPAVARAAGMPFRRPPVVLVRTRDQFRHNVREKVNEDLPPAVLDGVTAAYRLFGLIPDTLDLRALLSELYAEQVVAYFDPDSGALFVPVGTDPEQLRQVLAHELTHALQAQYVDLDSLLDLHRDDADRALGAQAFLEGHAMLVATLVGMPERRPAELPPFWSEGARAEIARQQATMPVLSRAPAVVREELVWAYLGGADFARWYRTNRPDPFPVGAALPSSSEQILHPERYAAGDAPVRLAFTDTAGRRTYDNGLGEFEIRILLTRLAGREAVAAGTAEGWGGDRYRVFPTEDALVWYVAWDTPAAADRFVSLLKARWRSSGRGLRRWTIERLTVDGKATARVVDAPAGWGGWRALPTVRGVSEF